MIVLNITIVPLVKLVLISPFLCIAFWMILSGMEDEASEFMDNFVRFKL